MPEKGSKYATIDINLRQWCYDEMKKCGISQIELAKELDLNRARITDAVKGRLNTMGFLETVVKKRMEGDYLGMAKYATTPEGLQMLKELNRKKNLTPYEQEIWNNAADILFDLIKKNPDKAAEKLKKLENNN